MNRLGELYIYREMDGFETISPTVKAIKNLEDGQRIYSRIMDAYFGQKPYANTGRTVKQEFIQAGKDIGWNIGFRMGPAGPGSVEAGHQTVRTFLDYDGNKPIDGTNCPRLFIFENCKKTIKSFRNYRYIERTVGMKDRGGQSEVVAEKYKDYCDAVRFICQLHPKYVMRSDTRMPKTHFISPTDSKY